MFDWPTAVDRLHRISKEQVVRFLAGPDNDDVYGVGLFCDAYDGAVYLVANTEQFHRASLCDFEARFGQTDPEVFRWDIGNWKYPGGLFLSSSVEQQAFDSAWDECREPLSQIESDDKQGMLEDACVEVLMRLFKGGAFSTAPRLKGLTVLGPAAGQEDVLAKKKRLDSLLQPGLARHQR